jgi:hypothetical protein
MKPPPLLLAAALLFWGWQTDMLKISMLMALILESARVTKFRVDFSDDDFARLWTFCTLVFLGTAVYAFTANEGPSQIVNFFENPNSSNSNSAGNASALAAAAFFRWLPITFFLFVAAQVFSTRDEIPMNTISLIMRVRWKRAAKRGRPMPAARGVNVGYPYFAICVFSASIHEPALNNSYFWGLCGLLVWSLWTQRSRRFLIWTWAGALALAVTLGFSGQYGIAQLAGYFGRMNPQWMFHFPRSNSDPTQNRTAIGQVGRLKLSGAIVIRVEPETGPAPTYLREASYRAYTSNNRIWLAGHSRDDFENVAYEKDGMTWRLVPGKTNMCAVSLACFLDGGKGLLPLPEDCGELRNLPAFVMQKNSAGSVLAFGPGLVIFDALYGPGPEMDSPPDEQDIAVPESEKPAINQAIAELQLTSTNLDMVLHSVGAFFQNEFTYSTWLSRPKSSDTNETDVARFLLKTRSGHCEYFATATTLLLRELKIPTRYAVGYMVHEKSGDGYVVRERDAHSWCRVWNEKHKRWQDFDTTPAVWVGIEGEHKSPLQWLGDFWSWTKFQFSKFRWGQTHLRNYILITIVPVLVLLLGQIIFRRKPKKKKLSADGMPDITNWPGLDSEFYLIEQKLAARGVPRQKNEPLTDWLERATTDSSLLNLRKPLRELLRLHYCCRFDPCGLDVQRRAELKRGARTVLDSLEQN